MANSALHNDHFVTASEFFSRAQERLTFDVPVGLADPNVPPRHDAHDTDPAVLAAIAAVRPIRPAAVLVPIIEYREPSVLFTQRTGHLADHGGQISFPGGRVGGETDTTLRVCNNFQIELGALARFGYYHAESLGIRTARR